ncbi:hypothetical protein DB347_12820 [Opitutaceae bacterium EW11]|nr:hypothetical protein DB347_12820 [Opitutaceae bacterium EW11]
MIPSPMTDRRSPLACTFCLSLVLAASFCLAVRTTAQADGAQRWAFSTLSSSTAGNIVATPATGPDGAIYIGVEIGTSTSSSNTGKLFAVNPDGSVKWTFDAPDWIDSTPAVGSDGTVYVGCWNGVLYALKSDGTKLWSYDTHSFIASSPALATDGTVYVGAGNGNLYAIASNGTLKWTYPSADWVDSAPAVAPDGTIVFGSWDSTLYAVNPDGTEKWHYKTAGNLASSPAIAANGTVYIGCRDDQLYAFSPDGSLKWTFDAADVIDSSPVIGNDGTVYVGSLGGRLFALNPDGTEKWRYPRADQAALKSISSTPAVRADGSILFGTGGGGTSGNAVYALRADGTLLWSTALGDWVDSSPLVSDDGAIYVGCTDKKLYSLKSGSSPFTADWSQYHRDPFRNGQQVMGAKSGTTGRLINLSARADAGTGDNTLITGFIIAGTGQRNVMVRGIGPTLSQFGVASPLQDPILTTYVGAAPDLTNDNWGTATNQSVIGTATSATGAFSLPAGSKDAIIAAGFPGGPHTVHVTAAAGTTTGVALMEVYDFGGDASARLSNLSARSTVGTGANVLIAGVIVSGSTRSVVIRGVGPTLAQAPYNVGGVLADPQLRLYKSQQVIAENNDWLTASDPTLVKSAMQSSGAFPLPDGSKDAVLVVTLPPGAYTAQVSGVNLTSGVAIVELYELP